MAYKDVFNSIIILKIEKDFPLVSNQNIIGIECISTGDIK